MERVARLQPNALGAVGGLQEQFLGRIGDRDARAFAADGDQPSGLEILHQPVEDDPASLDGPDQWVLCQIQLLALGVHGGRAGREPVEVLARKLQARALGRDRVLSLGLFVYGLDPVTLAVEGNGRSTQHDPAGGDYLRVHSVQVDVLRAGREPRSA